MSDATKAAIADAIAAHIADDSEVGDIAGAWVVVVECLNLENVDRGEAAHFYVSEGSQFACRGLVESLRDTMRMPPDHDDEE